MDWYVVAFFVVCFRLRMSWFVIFFVWYFLVFKSVFSGMFAVVCSMFSLFTVCVVCILFCGMSSVRFYETFFDEQKRSTCTTSVTTHSTHTPSAHPRTHHTNSSAHTTCTTHDNATTHNVQLAWNTKHTTNNVQDTYKWIALARSLSGSWHTRTLHTRQRSVQIRFGGLNSFACPLGADDRVAQEQSLRGSSSTTNVSQFVGGTTLHTELRSHSGQTRHTGAPNLLHLLARKRCLRVDDPASHHFMLFKPRTSFRNSRGCAKSHNLCSLHEQASCTTYVSTPSVCPRVCCTQSRYAIDKSCMFWKAAVRNKFHLSVNLHRQCQGLGVKAGSPCAAFANDVTRAHWLLRQCCTESPPSLVPTKRITSISNTQWHSSPASISIMKKMSHTRTTSSLSEKRCVVSVLTLSLLTLVLSCLSVGACCRFDVQTMTNPVFDMTLAITECCPISFCE